MKTNTLSLSGVQSVYEKLLGQNVTRDTVVDAYGGRTYLAIGALYHINGTKQEREHAISKNNNFKDYDFQRKFNCDYESYYTIIENLKALEFVLREEDFEAYKTDLNDWIKNKANYLKESVEAVNRELELK